MAARNEQIVGQSFSGDLKVFQVEALEKMFSANVTANSFDQMAGFFDRHLKGELQIGNVTDLVERWKIVHYNMLISRHRQSKFAALILFQVLQSNQPFVVLSDDNCFPEF